MSDLWLGRSKSELKCTKESDGDPIDTVYSFRIQETMSKFKFHVRLSPCDYHVVDKWNVRT